VASKLFYLPFRPALNLNGLVIPGAKLYFYLTGTETLAPIYAGESLSVPLANPVTANAAGRWPSVYLDDTIVYRVVLKDASGVTIPGMDVDPYLSSIVDDLTQDLQDIVDATAQNAANAQAAATAAETAAAVFTYELGAFLKRAEGVLPGQYFAAVNLPFDIRLSKFYGRVLSGGGTCSVTIVRNGVPVLGPIPIGDPATETPTTLLLPEGSDLLVQVDNISGSVVEIAVQLTGAPE
jgi:hypothetical protein